MYFITICTAGKAPVFGTVQDGTVVLNDCGRIAEQCLIDIPVHFPGYGMDLHVVMPNHVHAIIGISGDKGTACRAPTHEKYGQPVARSLATIVRSYKAALTAGINKIRRTEGQPVWQRNFFEHVIRNEQGLNSVREYIQFNPQHWAFDADNPVGKQDKQEIEFWNDLGNDT